MEVKGVRHAELRHVTIWELRELYGFKMKGNPQDWRGNFWSHHRMTDKSDLEIYKLWVKQHGDTTLSNPGTGGTQ